MSFTSTATTAATIHCKPERTTGILLSPSKRRRLSSDGKEVSHSNPSAKDLWKWTLTSDAVVSCFVHDILEMKENTEEGYDFFWLGHVPCRSVLVLGMVIGFKVYEKRIVYSVDDGTSVIDCIHTSTPPPQSPTKQTSTKLKTVDIKKPEPPPLPTPKADIGDCIRVTGKVRRKYESRHIIVDCIECCSSPNDEVNHWRTVRMLHKLSYSLPGPFFIPPPSKQTIIPVSQTNADRRRDEPATPSTVVSTPGSSTLSSPAKSESHPSPQKLRHPSRLHSRDLTDNTFRIYMKHYMDNSCDTVSSSKSEFEYDSDTAVSSCLAHVPMTPTKRSKGNREDATPRFKIASSRTDRTPRPRIQPISFVSDRPSTSLPAPPSRADDIRGFTLSYLRRVPELQEMAGRTVLAEAKRRTREERAKAKEAGDHSKARRIASSSSFTPAVLKAKMKRLFKWALRQLLSEGSIIVWDGPVRPILDSLASNTSGLWKASSTVNSTMGADSTIFSSTTGLTQINGDSDIDGGGVSDPEPDEEGYVPLKPTFLASHVENAIKHLSIVSEKSDKRKMDPRVSIAGVTKEAVLTFLRRDDRWRYVGDWHVDATLKLLETDGRVWCVGHGKWDLTQ